MFSRRFVTVSAEILKAVRNGDPVVALESTIITHGMPFPKNYDMSLKVKKILRDKGVIPATVGIVGGHILVGMNKDDIHELAQETENSGHKLVKVSRRDLPYVLSNKMSGGTTVAATMMIAHKAGIPIFVTGGIGGVHRGAEVSFDVSADLTELGRTPVAVVSAGVKSILDIEKTLQYLETQGVSVASFGENGEFPSFFTPKSGFKAPYHVRTAEEAARMIHVNQVLQSKSGLLFGVPIPDEFSADGVKIESEIQAALKECNERHIVGKDVTPFVLARLNEISKGVSLRANLALIENNAKVGADIALELARLSSASSFSPGPTILTPAASQAADARPRPVVVGGSNFDFLCRVTEPNLRFDGSTMFGHIRSCFGGVGRNIADVLACLDSNPFFISSVGNDPLGQSILRHNDKLDKTGISVNSDPTSSYCVVLDFKGQARIGIGDINQAITPQQVEKHISFIRKSPLLILDANLGLDTINFVLEECQKSKIPVFFEPTDKNKGLQILKSPYIGALTYASPNLAELRSLAGSTETEEKDEAKNLNELLQECIHLSREVLDTIPFLVVTLGERGVLVVRRGLDTDPLPLKNASNLRKEGTFSAKHYPVSPFENVISVVGAGDCFTGAFVAGLLNGLDQDLAISVGIQAARLSLANEKTVPFDLSSKKIHWEKIVSNGRRLA